MFPHHCPILLLTKSTVYSGHQTRPDELQAEPVPQHAQPGHLPGLGLRQLLHVFHPPGAVLPGPGPTNLLWQQPES